MGPSSLVDNHVADFFLRLDTRVYDEALDDFGTNADDFM